VAAAVLVGGSEKLPAGGVGAYGDVRVVVADDPRDAVAAAIREFAPGAVLDLSDEPVLDYRTRFALVAVALACGVPYEGADFSFSPPAMPRVATKPALAIIGTGKRTGKTAVAGFVARTLAAHGIDPVIVAMGRGGPAEPEVLRGDEIALAPDDLMRLVREGKHAASDYVEDALLARVPTVGSRRCGGGLAGGVDLSNVARGVEVANELPGDLLILEGSGSSIPPVHADAVVLVVPASVPEEYVTGYLGPYRVLLADFVLVTMCEEPFGSPSKISSLTSHLGGAWRLPEEGKRSRRKIEVVRTVFRPTPTRAVEGADVFVATTAPEAAAASIRAHLESEHGCRVTGISHSLSNRPKLEAELAGAGTQAEVLLCEIKAAGIDVATMRGLEQGMDVVYMDNVPVGVDGDDVESLARRAGELAVERTTAFDG